MPTKHQSTRPSYFVALFFAIWLHSISAFAASHCGGNAEEISPGKIYRTTSYTRGNGQVFIYVVRSSANRVLVIGMGWGDPSSGPLWSQWSDAKSYLLIDAANDSKYDSDQLDKIITDRNCLNLSESTAIVTFLVPHAHFDHLNAEMVRAMEDRGYYVENIYVHRNDSYLLCGTYYCGTNPWHLFLPTSLYLSAPFRSSMSSLAGQIKLYGSTSDDCSSEPLRFPYFGGGEIRVRLMSFHSPGKSWAPGKDFHTMGAVNLFVDAEKLVLVGASPKESNCAATPGYFPPGYKTLCQHPYSCTGNQYPPAAE